MRDDHVIKERRNSRSPLALMSTEKVNTREMGGIDPGSGSEEDAFPAGLKALDGDGMERELCV